MAHHKNPLANHTTGRQIGGKITDCFCCFNAKKVGLTNLSTSQNKNLGNLASNGAVIWVLVKPKYSKVKPMFSLRNCFLMLLA